MSTAEIKTGETGEVTITSHALDLLECFQDGLDEVVQHLAADFARKRNSGKTPSESVQIDVQDVRAAGAKLVQLVSELVAKGQLPGYLESYVQGMGDCLNCK